MASAHLGLREEVPVRPSELVQMAYVARRFYLDGFTQVAIAEELGISRFAVAKTLEAAKEHGVVRITVNRPVTARANELADELVGRFGLRDAVVIAATSDSQPAVHAALGPAAAELLTGLVTATDVIGLTSGRTIAAMVAQLTRLPPCAAVQMTGLGGAVTETSAELVRQLSVLSGGVAFPMYVPLVVSDAQAAQALLRQDSVRTAYAKFAEISKAFVAVGAWQPTESQLAMQLGQGDREHLAQAGAVAEVCGSFFNTAGKVITQLADRVIAISAAELRAIPEVIAVAGGSAKVGAITAVLRSGILSTLVTDAQTAQRVLAANS